MRPFDDLVAEAVAADTTGWGFAWLDGRAVEERPPWGYVGLLGARLAQVASALDIDTGGGEVLSEAAAFPPRMAATESWPPNAMEARHRLGRRGVEVVQTAPGSGLPFPDESFELATARHPLRPDWEEIHRVLVPGGHYFAQHVGPSSATDLIGHFLGPAVGDVGARDPERERARAERTGLVVEDLRTARCRMEFYDVGAIVWILRKCIWWVPGFSVEAYADTLRELDAQMRAGQAVVAYSTRHLLEAVRPPR